MKPLTIAGFTEAANRAALARLRALPTVSEDAIAAIEMTLRHAQAQIQAQEMISSIDAVVTAQAATALERAITIVQHALSDGTWHPAAAVIAAGRAQGVSASTIDRARRSLGVRQRRARGTFHAPSEWRMSMTRVVEQRNAIGRAPQPQQPRSIAA